jgi:hypothetical protein
MRAIYNVDPQQQGRGNNPNPALSPKQGLNISLSKGMAAYRLEESGLSKKEEILQF